MDVGLKVNAVERSVESYIKLMFTEEPIGNEASVVKVGSQATTPDK